MNIHINEDDRGYLKMSNPKRNKRKTRHDKGCDTYAPYKSKLRRYSRRKQRRILHKQFRCNIHDILDRENKGLIDTRPYYRGMWWDVYC